jgi:hypothetical protein
MTTSRSGDTRKRADAAFKSKSTSKSESATGAAAQITAERYAREDKTARLRALRLAKEAADQEATDSRSRK